MSEAELQLRQCLVDDFEKQNPDSPIIGVELYVEYQRFLQLKIHHRDTLGTLLSPSCWVQYMWDRHRSYADHYRRFQDDVGTALRPRPSSLDDDLSEYYRYQNTLRCYRNLFEDAPPSDIWPPASPTVATIRSPASPFYGLTKLWLHAPPHLLQTFILSVSCPSLHLRHQYRVCPGMNIQTVKMLFTFSNRALVSQHMTLCHQGQPLEDHRSLHSYDINETTPPLELFLSPI